MASSPFYHLRPNKYIDRHLFVQVLSGLRKKYVIEKYQYIGFGSFMFDDFKILHNQLGIVEMISLENDETVYKRALFNKPYRCITIQHVKSSDFIDTFLREKNFIFWLDYTNPAELGGQLSEFCSLINNKMESGDIVRITLNANPGSLDDKNCTIMEGRSQTQIYKNRIEKLRERIPDYMPSNIDEHNMSSKKYPLFLLSCLKKAAMQTLAPSIYQKKYLFPLFSSVYADGQQMLTLTAIVLDCDGDRDKIKDCLDQYCDYVKFEWNKPCYIEIPELTTKEIIHVNNLLPANRDLITRIKNDFSFAFKNNHSIDAAIKSYVDYYKYYPNFHHVNF